MPGGDICRARRCIVGGSQLTRFSRCARLALGFVEQFGQHPPTPTATGARTETFAELARSTRLLDAQEVDDLALGHMEAEAEFVVEVHSQGARVAGLEVPRECGAITTHYTLAESRGR